MVKDKTGDRKAPDGPDEQKKKSALRNAVRQVMLWLNKKIDGCRPLKKNRLKVEGLFVRRRR